MLTTPLQEILVERFVQKGLAHFYLFHPAQFSTLKEGQLLAWAIQLIAQCYAHEKRQLAADFCRQIENDNHPDVLAIAGPKRGERYTVADFEALWPFLQWSPVANSHRFVLVDQAQKMSTTVHNKLLKVLEDPPGHLTFVLLLSAPAGLPATIESRGPKLRVILTPSPTTRQHDLASLFKQLEVPSAVSDALLSYLTDRSNWCELQDKIKNKGRDLPRAFKAITHWASLQLPDEKLFAFMRELKWFHQSVGHNGPWQQRWPLLLDHLKHCA